MRTEALPAPPRRWLPPLLRRGFLVSFFLTAVALPGAGCARGGPQTAPPIGRTILLTQPILRPAMQRALAGVPGVGRVEFHRLAPQVHLSPHQVVKTGGAHRYSLFAPDGSYLLSLEMGENAAQRFTLTMDRQEFGPRPATETERRRARALMGEVHARLRVEQPGLPPL